MKKFSLKKIVNQFLVFSMAIGVCLMGNVEQTHAKTYYSNTPPAFMSAPSGTYVFLKDSQSAIGFKARAGTDYSYDQVKNSGDTSRYVGPYNDWQYSLYKNVNGQWQNVAYNLFTNEKDYNDYTRGGHEMYDIGVIRPKKPVTAEEYDGTYYVEIYNYQRGSDTKRAVNSPQFNIKVVTLPEGKHKWNNLEWEYNGNTKTLIISGKELCQIADIHGVT